MYVSIDFLRFRKLLEIDFLVCALITEVIGHSLNNHINYSQRVYQVNMSNLWERFAHGWC